MPTTPFWMISLAFILGDDHLVAATGAGAEHRQALCTAVFFGMIGVTFFGLVFTPTFYVACRTLRARLPWRRRRPDAPPVLQPAE